MRKPVAAGSLLLLACGCAHYQTPGGGVSIPAITDAPIAEALARQPAAQFPAHVIVARVQAAGYESASGRGFGKGRYSVLTARDIETEEDFAQLASLPGVAGVGAINRILLPVDLHSAQELREAAAHLRGDIILLYTIDTRFEKSRLATTCAAIPAEDQRPRLRELGVTLGVFDPGPLNAITDVRGVRVGHRTVIEGERIRTGVTAIVPHEGNVFQDKMPAAVVIGNGFGKLMGTTQIVAT